MKKLIIISVIVAVVSIFAIPTALFADPPDGFTGAFVCPVIENDAVGLNNPNAVPLGEAGHYTIGQTGPNTGHIVVPVDATNGNGTATPGDADQNGPGDPNYTAIWAD